LAIAAPMLREPPVTSATLPASGLCCVSPDDCARDIVISLIVADEDAGRAEVASSILAARE
jgi:hypothetical protein